MLEKQIEDILIEELKRANYVFRDDIHDRKTMEDNFREKFNKLNHVNLLDVEFRRLLEQITTSDVFEASRMLRERKIFFREDGIPLQFSLVNTKDWCKNDYEVVRQLRINTQNSFQRYDVILLINGLPVVQVELKTLDVSPRRAIQQIVDYKRDTGNGYTNSLLCFIQLFVVSNMANTYYFANNNNQHFNFNADERFLPVYHWAGKDNIPVTGLTSFTENFLAKCKLGEIISRYMVLVASEQKLLIMRPYQIYAVKEIINCIDENRGNGYIWHTTGSGKTLTSFKASTLLKENPDIEKCLFVVDRKDLDRQTRDEFNRFQEGCVEENTNTETLVERLESNDYSNKVIVTTIQKLGLALDAHYRKSYRKRLESLSTKRMAIIFDECHRSQFGDNHKAIKEFFPNAQLFGFTGTPIFEENATYTQVTGEEKSLKTTEDIFQKELHSYTITHAINDHNVLRFHVDYFQPEGNLPAEESKRKLAIVDAIIDKHDAATGGRKFNALFATGSINDAIEYYHIFKQEQARFLNECEDYMPLNINCIFSPPASINKDNRQFQEDLEQEKYDYREEPNVKKKALQEIIKDYNAMFNTNHSVVEFDAYYQDLQKRIKDQQYSNHDYPHSNKIDITIVVDMLLTGFDSKYLNTLYVDKNLRYHQLIQAFSRTNRVLNDSKPYGNILDFRAQQTEVDQAIALFSGENRKDEARRIWLVEPASEIIGRYKEAVAALSSFMQTQDLGCTAEDVYALQGDEARLAFVNYFKEVQRCRTQLDQYTDISQEQKTEIDNLLSKEELQGFRGAYLETARQLRAVKNREDNTPEINEQIDNYDFEFVLFASALIDYDYIMDLIARYAGIGAKKLKITKDKLISLIQSSANLMDERDDIIAYIDSLEKEDAVNGRTEREIREGYEVFKTNKYANEIIDIAHRHQLSPAALQEFIDDTLARNIFDSESLNDLLEPLELGWKARAKEESQLMDELIPVLYRLSNGQEISGLSAYEGK